MKGPPDLSAISQMVEALFAGRCEARIQRAFHFKASEELGQTLAGENIWVAQLVVRGLSIHDIGPKHYQSRAGDFLLIPPNTAQTYRHRPGTAGYILMFSIENLSNETASASQNRIPTKMPPQAISLTNAWALTPHFKDLIHEFHRAPSDWTAKRLRSRLALFLSEWILSAESSRRGKVSLSSDQAEILYSRLAERLESNPDSRELAKVLHLSHDYFCRVFANTFGISPRKFILQEKMLRASELLRHSELSVSAVADRLGYASPASFSRLYKQVCGENPGRMKNKGG